MRFFICKKYTSGRYVVLDSLGVLHYSYLMRYLGIDYGQKRIGFAVGDEAQGIAFPREVISGDWQKVRHFIEGIIRVEQIGAIVLGLPKMLSGKSSSSTEAVEEFKAKIEKAFLLPIHMVNEVISTNAVYKGSTKKDRIDAASAALILQSFFDSHKK